MWGNFMLIPLKPPFSLILLMPFHPMLQLHQTTNDFSRCCLRIITFEYLSKGYYLYIPHSVSFPFPFLAGNPWVLNLQWIIICTRSHKTNGHPKQGDYQNIENKSFKFQYVYNFCAILKTRIIFCSLAITFILSYPKQRGWSVEGSMTEFRASASTLQLQAHPESIISMKTQPDPQDQLSPNFLYCGHIISDDHYSQYYIWLFISPFPC